MATSWTLISPENFSTSWQRTYNFKPSSSKDSYRYLYICAPCWYLVVTCKYGAFGGSGIFQVEPSYWNGSTWVSCGAQETDSSSSSSGKTHKYGHNRIESGTTAYWNNKYPLWEIKYWSSRNNANGSMDLYVGSWGVAKNGNTLLNYPQDKKIFSAGRTEDCIHGASSQDRENVLNNIFNPANRRGSLISAAYEVELICAPYLDSTY